VSPWFHGVLCALSVGCCTLQACGQVTTYTVPGPEAEDLLPRIHGTIVFDRPVAGIETVRLPQLETTTPLAPDPDRFPVHSVGGPDASGRIAFVVNDMTGKKHALRLLAADGKSETIFTGKGDALWEDAVGEHLALDATGTAIALVVRAKGVQNHDPDALIGEGELEIWRVADRKRIATGLMAVDDVLSWFPEGKRLAYTAFVPKEQAAELLRVHVNPDEAFGRKTIGWARVPVIHELDVETGKSRPLHVGQRPLVSPDGKVVLLRDFELNWRLLDLETNVSRPFVAAGAIYPGAIAFADANTVLFWAWPTEGRSVKLTEHNSPLVGPKQMRALKLVDLQDGRFQTVVPHVDPRRNVSFGR
jgi:hypothetical protein